MQNKKKKMIQMSLNKKRTMFQITTIICLIAVGILVRNISSSKSSLETTSLLKNQRVENLLFTDASLENNKLKVAVHHTKEGIYSLKTITVSFLDVDNNIITSVEGYIGNEVTTNFPKQLVVETDEDLSHAVNIRYTINK